MSTVSFPLTLETFYTHVWKCAVCVSITVFSYRVFPGRASLGPAVALKPPLLNSPSSGSWTWAGLPDWLRRILETTKTLMSVWRKTGKKVQRDWENVAVWKQNRKGILFTCIIFKTYFPQSFLMPLWFFLFSGETGDCCPESTPEDRGDWSDRTHSSSFSGRPVRQKYNKIIIDTLIHQSK